MKISLPQALVLIAIVLATVAGGYPASTGGSLEPGIGPLILNFWTGDSAPILAHAIPIVLACTALAITLWQRRVIQAPSLRFWACLGAFLAILGASVVFSRFTMVSIQTWLEWLSYGAITCAVVATMGRGKGPHVLLWTLTGAVGFVAVRGVMEYAGQSDPTWRIFAGWVNPNALAGILLLGLFPALGLVMSEERPVTKVAAAAIAVMIGLALVLTQSKGGYAAAVVGAVAILVLGAAWSGVRRAGLAAIPILLVAVLAVGLSMRKAPAGAPGGGALARVAQASSTSEQSSGFRILLWKTAIALTKERPTGSGIGTFRFESARPGLVQQTVLAHQSWLQLAAEASPIALGLIVVMLVLWLAEMFRGARSVPAERNLARASVVAAVAAGVAHSFIDSDLYYFGSGFVFFALLGCGLQLSADGSGPELLPKNLRRAVALAGCGILAVGSVYFGAVDGLKARVRGAFAARDAETANSALNSLAGLASSDGEVYAMRAATRTGAERLADLRLAAKLNPTTSNFRALATTHLDAKEYVSAVEALKSALEIDPNNFGALSLLIEAEVGQDQLQAAIVAARRLVEVEETSYFKIRALPEVIPTATYSARLFLAKQTTTPAEQIEWLQPAVDGYVQYAETTVPRVKLMDKEGVPFAGETLVEAQAKLAEGLAAADLLIRAYEASGKGAEKEKAKESRALLAQASAA
ncbi:MAG: O-antigen ligase family protein [Fimbriimonadaceae bacterium]|nr:O-antigen ligase family protein [Fimbriimonadaceae bacterium]